MSSNAKFFNIIRSKVGLLARSKRTKYFLGGLGLLFPGLLYNKDCLLGNSKIDASWFKLRALCDSVQRVPYVVIGGGSAAFYSALSILMNDPNAKVLLISEHEYLPFSFDTKGKNSFFQKEIVNASNLQDLEEVKANFTYPVAQYFVQYKDLLASDKPSLACFVNSKVVRVDSEEKKLVLDENEVVYYNKLIIATEKNVKPNKHLIDSNIPKERFIEVNTLDDYIKVLNLYKEKNKRVAIVGSCDHAFSLSLTLASKKEGEFNVSLIDENISDGFSHFLPSTIMKSLNDELTKKNIYYARSKIRGVKNSSDGLSIRLNNGINVDCDMLIVFNEKVNTDEFVSGQRCEGQHCPERHPNFPIGYSVDKHLKVKDGDIFAVGENIVYHEPMLDMDHQVSSFEHNLVSGKIGGRNATGLKDSFDYLPVFNYNLTESIRFQSMGIISSDFETTSVWKESKAVQNNVNGKGVIFYHKDGIIQGMVLWNIAGKLGLCEEIIEGKHNISDAVEIAKWILPRTELKDLYPPQPEPSSPTNQPTQPVSS